MLLINKLHYRIIYFRSTNTFVCVGLYRNYRTTNKTKICTALYFFLRHDQDGGSHHNANHGSNTRRRAQQRGGRAVF